MTKTAEVQEVAAHFSDWLRQVAEGHEVVITEQSRPLAKLVAAESGQRKFSSPLDVPPLGKTEPISQSATAPGTESCAALSPSQRAESLDAWIKANGLPGRWIGEVPLDTAIIAEEMFDRQ